MRCCIRSSKSKGRAPGNLNMGRFWKGEDCSRMSSRATLEGINPFCEESQGPDHPQGWEPPTPGEGGMVPSTGHIYDFVLQLASWSSIGKRRPKIGSKLDNVERPLTSKEPFSSTWIIHHVSMCIAFDFKCDCTMSKYLQRLIYLCHLVQVNGCVMRQLPSSCIGVNNHAICNDDVVICNLAPLARGGLN